MNSALIGYTGFIGSNLCSQKRFEYLYNSRNYFEMEGKFYDEVICVGVAGVKWYANKHPQNDIENIIKLQNILATVEAKRFILISTIDVYPMLQGKDESFNCHGIKNHAYGTNRLAFEHFCIKQFINCYIIRLPALFGTGLKKNVIYDLLNNNCLENINSLSSFQYYYLKNLLNDVQTIIDSGVHLINLISEPINTQTIINRFFPKKNVGKSPADEMHYDLYSSHAKIFGKNSPYIYDSDEIMQGLEDFIFNKKNTSVQEQNVK